MKNFVYVFTQRSLLIILGFITLFFVTLLLDDHQQGYYYTFGSIISAYNLFELGLPFLILQISSKYFKVHGETYELNHSSYNFIYTLRKYLTLKCLISLLIFIPAGVLYFYLFSEHERFEIFFFWIIVSVAIPFAIYTNTVLSLIEGLGEIKNVYLIKTIGLVFGSLCLWILLNSKYYLIGPSVIIIFTFLATISLIVYKYKFWFSKNRQPIQKIWKNEIYPIQKKVAYVILANYLFYFTPAILIFPYSVSDAGKFGLSVVVISSILALSSSFFQSKIYFFTNQFNNNDILGSNKTFLSSFLISQIIYLIISTTFFLFYYFVLPDFILSRLLNANYLFILFINYFMMNNIYLFSFFFRIRKKDSFSFFYFLSVVIMLLLQLAFLNDDHLKAILYSQSFIFSFLFICSIFLLFKISNFKIKY